MYVITMATGSYDDYGVEVIAVTNDYDKGLAYVNKKNTAFASLEPKIAKLRAVIKQWEAANPQPKMIDLALKAIPRWTGNCLVTKEMRQEREEIELYNQDIARKAAEPRWEWYKKLQEFTNKWAQANLTADELEIYPIMNENQWHIEETKWL